ncbi:MULTISPECIES: dynamin family protein [Pseudomonas]|uniref:Dynamin family protein n=1 Tax=Pseudomonas aphyarum TaxID=2942629 RepID=A0ABT5PQ94_9PSED|nr:dynamin family protein [Pseudomonas aphyarum]MDD0971056.1 dynamin family protein [Pseudomonas aphyarum]MDD1125978.1 dynamin family protein [Pseudomonas aphyarum]
MKTELFSPALLDQLDKLGQWFIRHRKRLHNTVVESLLVADDRHDTLSRTHQDTVGHLASLKADHAQLTERQARTRGELDDTRHTLHETQGYLKDANTQHLQAQKAAMLRFDTLSARHAQLVQERNGLEQARLAVELSLERTRSELQTGAEALDAATRRHELLSQEHHDALEQLDALSTEHGRLSARQAATAAELDNTRLALEDTRQSLENTHQDLQNRLEAHDALQRLLEEEQQQRAQLTDEFIALHQRHGDTWTRFQLISGLLAARPRDNAGLMRFKELLSNEYMAFADGESSLATEATAVTMLQSIQQELALLVGFPEVHQRTIVGIVGGFSSGKSEFINSFIQDPEVRLPVGIQPVTAIPSYVLATTAPMIRGYSANGGHIPLEVDFYKSISHAFINSFSFDLKSLMPFMCVGVRMHPAHFSHICLIDTPGYNPPLTAAEHSHGDKRTAIQFARQADVIVWLIGLDVNGTVPDSDLNFIQEIGVEQRPVYVVLTKADLKALDHIEEVMEEVREVLEDVDIVVAGISAYSSTLRNEVAYRDVPLLEFFSQINQLGDARLHLDGRLREVFSMYDHAIQADIARMRAQKTAINGLRLDSLEIGGKDAYERMLGPINKLDNNLDIAPLERCLNESRQLFEAFSDAVRLTVEASESEV